MRVLYTESMEINIESIIFYLLLLDALVANYLAFTHKQHWWHTHFGTLERYFPLSKGWTVYYILLVILMGIMLIRFSALVVPFT